MHSVRSVFIVTSPTGFERFTKRLVRVYCCSRVASREPHVLRTSAPDPLSEHVKPSLKMCVSNFCVMSCRRRANPSHMCCASQGSALGATIAACFFKHQHSVRPSHAETQPGQGTPPRGGTGGVQFRTRKCCDESSRAFGVISPALLLHFTFLSHFEQSWPGHPSRSYFSHSCSCQPPPAEMSKFDLNKSNSGGYY